jgi:hypothetical protein
LVFISAAAAGVLSAHDGTRQALADDPAAPQAEPPPQGRQDLPLREFMRKKLDASNKVLEGLVLEDAALVKEGAHALTEMSTAEKWRVSNDAMYRQFSGEFRRITQQLEEAAAKENLDQAALQWMDTTLSCIECHRYVRTVLVTESGAEQ